MTCRRKRFTVKDLLHGTPEPRGFPVFAECIPFPNFLSQFLELGMQKGGFPFGKWAPQGRKIKVFVSQTRDFSLENVPRARWRRFFSQN